MIMSWDEPFDKILPSCFKVFKIHTLSFVLWSSDKIVDNMLDYQFRRPKLNPVALLSFR